MAFVWVQQYLPLPIIFEDFGMGDELQRQQSQISDSYQTQSFLKESSPPSFANTSMQQAVPQDMEVAQYSQQQFLLSGHHGTPAIDMRALSAALPSYQQQSFQHQYPPQVISNQVQYHFQQGQQFAAQNTANYSQQFAQQYPQQYFQAQTRHNIAQNFQHGYQNQSFQVPQGINAASQQYLQPPCYGNRGASYQSSQLRINPVPGMSTYHQSHPQLVRRTSSNSSLQASVLRGPPRKPKQSGHALWVGNLPPGTHIIDLKDHFSRDAINDIESVFLISKSNCAFVNYKTEVSCAAAMARFHDSRFQSVRLVCRLRRGSNSGAGTPQVTSATTSLQAKATAFTETPAIDSTLESHGAETKAVAESETVEEKVKEKYFVVKSLTVEDLERSVASGVWATQAHNEDGMNKAYQTAENVYLIFSANKSGEYFGYARMDSAIDDEVSANLEVPMRPEVSSEPSASDLPLTIPTPATATAPKGRIIDDSARGTIFWEAENNDSEEDTGDTSGEGYESGVSAGGVSPVTSQTFGKPFKIVWMSTERLPFYRTRGLRNPWNANREVKIARDGTEIEPSVGRRLTSLFHKPHVPSTNSVNPRHVGVMMPQGYMPSPQGQMQGNSNPYSQSY